MGTWYVLMFCLGVFADILCLYIWPSTLVVEDVMVMLFYERVSDADTMLNDGFLTDDCVTGDLEELVRYTRGSQDWGYAIWREVKVSLTLLFADMETVLGLQGSEVDMDCGAGWALVWLWLQFIGLATYTIWARGVGPRFRPDQMSDLTWKDLLFFLAGLLALVIVTFYMVRCGVTSLGFCGLSFLGASSSLARVHFPRTRLSSCT